MKLPRIAAGQPLIELSCCSLILDGQIVLDDIDLTVRRGERWALIGPNGSGKTLLLKMLRGDLWPTPTGAERRCYSLDGVPANEPAGSKERIAYVGPERQDKYVRYGWNFTVAQIVATGLFDEDIPLTQPSRAQRERVRRVLRRFGLSSLQRRRVLTLSYGQMRRVLVARAFVSDARLLLLDEVFNGLDVRARNKLRRALERPRGGQDWVLTSHRAKELPHNVTHVARIEAGRIVEARPVLGPLGRASRARRRGHELQRSLSFVHGADEQKRPLTLLSGADDQSSSLHRVRGRRKEGAWLVHIHNANIYRDYRPVIRELNWTLRSGEHWAVLGANGAGKSTLLSLIYGDLHPALGGTIERRGLASDARIEEWKRRVGWVSPELQAEHFAAKSIEEVVIGGRYASVGLNAPQAAADRRIARRWLEFFGIAPLRERPPRRVSYGQMRLALLARAMVNEPELLLLDEPCSGLDADVRATVLREIERLAQHGTQLVMAVHDVEDVVPSIGRVLTIGRGGKVRSDRIGEALGSDW